MDELDLISRGFNRVERDDRLLDVFPRETAEKGVELWEKWGPDGVELIRIHCGLQSRREFSRAEIEKALVNHHRLEFFHV